MLYRKNMGGKERTTRLLGGALIAACSIAQIGFTPLGMVLAGSGMIAALTAVFGFCPACAMMGRRSIEGPK